MWPGDYNDYGNYYGDYYGGYDMDNGFTVLAFKAICLLMGVIGFAYCFFGYKIQKIVVALWAAIIFGGVGFGIPLMIRMSGTEVPGIAIGFAALVGVIFGACTGYKAYKNIYIFLSGFTTFLIVISIGAATQNTGATIIAAALGIALGIGVSLLVRKFYKPLVILLTGINGGYSLGTAFYLMGAYTGLYDFLGSVTANYLQGLFGGGGNSGGGSLTMSFLFIVVGVYFQFRTCEHELSEIISPELPGLLIGNKLSVGTGNESAGTAADRDAADSGQETGCVSGGDAVYTDAEERRRQEVSTAAAKKKFNQILDTELKVNVKYENAHYFFLAGAIMMAFDGLTGVSSVYGIYGLLRLILELSMALIFAFWFDKLSTRKIPPKVTVSAFLTAEAAGTLMLVLAIFDENIVGIVYLMAVACLLTGLWLGAARSQNKIMLFYAADGLLLVNLLMRMTGRITAIFGVAAMVCITAPFIIPALRQRKMEGVERTQEGSVDKKHDKENIG